MERPAAAAVESLRKVRREYGLSSIAYLALRGCGLASLTLATAFLIVDIFIFPFLGAFCTTRFVFAIFYFPE